jgi:hypothetical protein
MNRISVGLLALMFCVSAHSQSAVYTYFIGLQRSGGPAYWGWESANATAQSLEAYQNGAGAWAYNTGLSLAFSLAGALSPAPEASTSLMCVLGLLLVGFFARRCREE